jgi:hypothetical protein
MTLKPEFHFLEVAYPYVARYVMPLCLVLAGGGSLRAQKLLAVCSLETLQINATHSWSIDPCGLALLIICSQGCLLLCYFAAGAC